MVTMDLMRYTINDSHLYYNLRHGNITTPINQPKNEAHTQNPKLETKTTYPALTMNSDNYFASMGLLDMGSFMRQAAERGRQAALEKTGEYASDRRQYGRISEGVTPAKIYKQKKRAEWNPGTLVLKQTAPVDIHFSEGAVEIHYTPGRTIHDWDVDRAVRSYTASQFNGRVDRVANVELEYIGQPLKTPHSANPPENTFYLPFDKRV